MNKLIITVAPVGAEITREDFPDLPITPDEIAEETYRCWNEGAAVVHIHARDPDGVPTQSPKTYREIVKKIRQRCDIIIQVSTGGAVGMGDQERIASLCAAPEMASLTLGSVNFGVDIFSNPRSTIEAFARAMRKQGIKPELEIFDTGMITTGLILLEQGILAAPAHWSFIMGVNGGIDGHLRNLVHMVDMLPNGHTWQVGGIGRHQLSLGACAITIGGHVRTGAEDNIYYRKGTKIKSSAELVKRIADLAALLERSLASPQEARRILSLPPS